MNKNAEMWCERLEKNDLPQTKSGWGHDEDGYCCLMVAAKLYEELTGVELPRTEGGFYAKSNLRKEFEVVRKWLGLRTANGGSREKVCGEMSRETSLVHLNDNTNATFPEAAAWIRTEPEGLFEEPAQ